MDTQTAQAETIVTRASGRRRFVKFHSERSRDVIDLELPGDCLVGDLLPDLIKALGWQLSEDGRSLHYRLRTETSFIDEKQTLDQAGIENSDELWVVLADEPVSAEAAPDVPAPAADDGIARGFRPMAEVEPSPQARRGNLAPPRPAQLEITEPSLVSEAAGLVFVLGAPPITIGRPGRGARPDIDLTEMPGGGASSRPAHAYIDLDGQTFLLRTVETRNGTFVNGEEIAPGQKRPLHNGDRILFGFRGAELTLRLPPT